MGFPGLTFIMKVQMQYLEANNMTTRKELNDKKGCKHEATVNLRMLEPMFLNNLSIYKLI